MSSIKNVTKMHNLNPIQQKGLKMQLNKLDLNNKLLLILNKKIEQFPHNKINDKLGGNLNQNIIFNFSNKNGNTDRRLKNTQFSLINNNTTGLTNVKGGQNAIKLLRSNSSDFGPVLVKTPSRLGIINNVVNILTSFFKELYCLIGRPQFINKADKLIIKILFYQNNTNKDALLSNNKVNFIYNLFNGKAAAKAQYSAPKSQNFGAILRDMLGQTKWNKIAKQILSSNNNETINTLELANISKKVFILFIKDLMNLTVSKKGLTIEKALSELQKGTPAYVSNSFGSLTGSSISKKGAIMSVNNDQKNKLGIMTQKRHNQLFMKLINSTNSDSLTRKRTRLSKTFFNKSLLAKIRNNINMYNNTDSLDVHSKLAKGKGRKNIAFKELIGRNALMSPVTKGKLNNLLEWSPENLDLSSEYKLISKALLLLLEAKNITVNNKLSSDTQAIRANILAHKINNNLISLLKQHADELNNKTNFINRTLQPSNSFGNPSNSVQEKGHLLTTFASNITNFPLLNRLNVGILNLINTNLNKQALIKNTSSSSVSGVSSSLSEALLAYKSLNYKNTINEKNNILAADATNLNKFKQLGKLLANIFKKNVDLQLIKLHNVGLDSEVLAKVISLNARFDKSSVLLKKVWRKVNISNASLIQFNKQNKILSPNALAYNPNLHNQVKVPVLSKLSNKNQLGVKLVNPISINKQNITLAQLYDQIKNVNNLETNPLVLGKVVGLNLRIAGRLRADAIKPKQTVKTISVGALSKDRSNVANLGSFTSKNRKGAYRVTVKMGHIRTFASSTKQLQN